MYEEHFNIFKLHDQKEDKRPGGWICVRGENIRKIIHPIISEILMSESPLVYVTLRHKFRRNVISGCSKLHGSQRNLAKKLGVSQQAVSKWHLGIRYIPLVHVKVMAKMLEIPDNEIKRNIKQRKFDYKKTISKFGLSKILASRLGCSYDIIWRSFSNKDYIPIPLILELLREWRKKTNKVDSDVKRVLDEINQAAEFLKLNNPISQPVKAIKNLDITLCKIMGAFAADGNLYLQIKAASFDNKKIKEIANDILNENDIKYKVFFDRTRRCYFFRTSDQGIIEKIKSKRFPRNIWVSFSYKVTLREQYRESVEIFSGWIESTFGIKLKARKSKGENEWFIVFTNKIIGRYLKNMFGFPAGKKARTVDEPLIIKKGDYECRKAFALGVMTFDGSVSLESRLRLMVKSKRLRDSIADIFAKEFGKSNLIIGLTKREEYYVQTRKNLPIKRMMEFIDAGTKKYKRLEMFLNLDKIALNDMARVFGDFEGDTTKLRFMDAFNILQKEGECDVYSMQKTVKRELGTDVSTITISRILNALSKTQFVNVEKRKQDKARSYRNIYNFGVPNENR